MVFMDLDGKGTFVHFWALQQGDNLVPLEAEVKTKKNQEGGINPGKRNNSCINTLIHCLR